MSRSRALPIFPTLIFFAASFLYRMEGGFSPGAEFLDENPQAPSPSPKAGRKHLPSPQAKSAKRKERLAVPCCGARRGTSLEGPWKMAQLPPDGILHGIQDGSAKDLHGARSRATGKQNPFIAPAAQRATGSYFLKKSRQNFPFKGQSTEALPPRRQKPEEERPERGRPACLFCLRDPSSHHFSSPQPIRPLECPGILCTGIQVLLFQSGFLPDYCLKQSSGHHGHPA